VAAAEIGQRVGCATKPGCATVKYSSARSEYRAATLRPGGPLLLAGLLIGLGAPAAALAHAFGTRYDLPLPLLLYLAGAGAAVALSFAVSALFLHGGVGAGTPPRLALHRFAWARALAHRRMLWGLRAAGVAGFVLVVAAGFAGRQSPLHNLAPTMVWVIGWVGLAYVCALVGNLWALVNPWDAVFRAVEALWARWRGCPLRPLARYPQWLGSWPAAMGLLAFVWAEIVYAGAEVPARLAAVLALYSALTWAGMAVFGRGTWLRHAELFSATFGLFARFAPLARGEGARGCYLQAPAAGLIGAAPVAGSTLAFVLVLLAAVTFDGLRETAAWVALLEWVAAEPALRTPLLWLRAQGWDLLSALETLGLVALPLGFLLIYLGFSRLMVLAARARMGSLHTARAFVLSLVPIAIAYHLAHYLSFLLLAGQLVIPLASDPFGYGWDLLGTANYRMNVSVVDARFAWYAAVAAIVAGHVFAVYVAHATALRVFGDPRAALRSQVPMLALMVGYTMTSLWILSQPIVE